MKHIILLLTFFIIQINYSQKQEIINPKEKWFFGLEIGSNAITSYNLGEDNLSFQGGVLTEYYFAKNWSLTGRIKYYEIRHSYFDPGSPASTSSSFLNLGWGNGYRPAIYENFSGNVIAIPVNVKWNFRIYNNLSANFKIGYSYTIETKSEYKDYSWNINSNDYPTKYGSLNTGLGFNYFIKKNIGIYLDFESYYGASKGQGNITNSLSNFGVKYNF